MPARGPGLGRQVAALFVRAEHTHAESGAAGDLTDAHGDTVPVSHSKT